MKTQKYVGLSFNGKWWDNAASNESVAPTRENIDNWIPTIDLQVASNVWHRYRLVGGRYKNMINWMKSTFFFQNATKKQLIQIEQLVRDLIFNR